VNPPRRPHFCRSPLLVPCLRPCGRMRSRSRDRGGGQGRRRIALRRGSPTRCSRPGATSVSGGNNMGSRGIGRVGGPVNDDAVVGRAGWSADRRPGGRPRGGGGPGSEAPVMRTPETADGWGLAWNALQRSTRTRGAGGRRLSGRAGDLRGLGHGRGLPFAFSALKEDVFIPASSPGTRTLIWRAAAGGGLAGAPGAGAREARGLVHRQDLNRERWRLLYGNRWLVAPAPRTVVLAAGAGAGRPRRDRPHPRSGPERPGTGGRHPPGMDAGRAFSPALPGRYLRRALGETHTAASVSDKDRSNLHA